ncbi:MAG: DUF6271 family protein [Acidimicrobiales bacterium]
MATKDNSSFLFIPTHRDCSPVLPTLFAEARYAAQREKQAIVCVIEHNLSEDLSDKHKQILLRLQQESGIRTLQMTGAKRRVFVDHTLSRLPPSLGADHDRLRSILLPAGISYGSGPDLAFLLAINLGCDFVHRRDSDVYLDEHRPDALPIELELGAIGKSIKDLKLVAEPPEGVLEKRDTRVRLVGTSTFGALTLDRRDLFAAGEEYAVAFQQLGRPGVERHIVREEAVSYLQEEPSTRYDTDFYELDEDGRVEMEACCFWEAFRFLPEMTTDIMGCDYMIKDALWQAGLLSIFHSRKLRHRYEQARADQTDLDFAVNYSLRDVQYIQIGRIWQEQARIIRDGSRPLFDDTGFHADVYAEAFDAASERCGAVLEEVRKGAQSVYESAAAAASGPLASRLRAVAEALEKAGTGLDRHVVEAVSDFTFLVRAWPSLISAAEGSQMLSDADFI